MSTALPYDERPLLQRIANGEEDAFKQLYDHYWNDLYHTALSFLKSPDWAMDIVQDVFLKIWIRRQAITSVENIRSYLFIATRNELLSALQSKARIDLRHEKYQQSLPDDFLLPDGAFQLKELQQTLQRAIESLPPQQKLMFRLTRQEGLSHEQIAEKLGVAKKTVSNTLTAALNTIRTFLKQNGIGDLMIGVLLLGCSEL